MSKSRTNILCWLSVCGALAVFVGQAHATTESITLDQAQPITWGETLTLTGVYTTEEKKSFPPRIYNPVVAVSCATGYRSAASQFGHQTNLGGGWWQGEFGYVIPAGSGPDTCTAWLEFTDSNGNTTVIASTQFSIS